MAAKTVAEARTQVTALARRYKRTTKFSGDFLDWLETGLFNLQRADSDMTHATNQLIAFVDEVKAYHTASQAILKTFTQVQSEHAKICKKHPKAWIYYSGRSCPTCAAVREKNSFEKKFTRECSSHANTKQILIWAREISNRLLRDRKKETVTKLRRENSTLKGQVTTLKNRLARANKLADKKTVELKSHKQIEAKIKKKIQPAVMNIYQV